MKNPGTIAVAMAWLVCFTCEAWATNIFFLPGDAFFHSRLTAETIAAIRNGETVAFGYSRPSHVGAFGCGFAGHQKLTYSNMADEFRHHLLDACDELRRSYPRRLTTIETLDPPKSHVSEENPLHLLIYNAAYDWKDQGLYLKFNENWTTEAKGPGGAGFFGGYVKPPKARDYEPFLRDADSLMNEWRDAAEIQALDVKLPEKAETNGLGLVLTPVELVGDAMFILIPDTLDKKFSKIPTGTEVMVVRKSGFTRFEYHRREGWIDVKEKPPEPTVD